MTTPYHARMTRVPGLRDCSTFLYRWALIVEGRASHGLNTFGFCEGIVNLRGVGDSGKGMSRRYHPTRNGTLGRDWPSLTVLKIFMGPIFLPILGVFRW